MRRSHCPLWGAPRSSHLLVDILSAISAYPNFFFEMWEVTCHHFFLHSESAFGLIWAFIRGWSSICFFFKLFYYLHRLSVVCTLLENESGPKQQVIVQNRKTKNWKKGAIRSEVAVFVQELWSTRSGECFQWKRCLNIPMDNYHLYLTMSMSFSYCELLNVK